MGSTKIIVVQLKQLIKTALFAVLGLIILGLLIYLFIPKDKTATSTLYTPGTYSSTIQLHNGQAQVQVTVNKAKITKIELVDLADTQEVFYPLMKPVMSVIAKSIIDAQSADVPVLASSPVTSGIIIDAVKTALTEATNETVN